MIELKATHQRTPNIHFMHQKCKAADYSGRTYTGFFRGFGYGCANIRTPREVPKI